MLDEMAMTFRNSAGQAVSPVSFKSSDAKNSFGAMLEAVSKSGMCAITNRDRVRAVVLSIEEYEALIAKVEDPIAELESEFDALVARMQTPKAKKAARGLFGATPGELGKAAVKAARRG